MRTRTKLTLASSFVGVVAMAAAAFGQAGPGGGSEEDKAPKGDRPAASAKDRDGCRPQSAKGRAGRLVHSEAKVQLREGFGLVTIDTGKVTAVDHSAKKITIKRADGETVTATAVDETNICKDGKKASFDAIKVGDFARLMSIRSERFSGLRRIGVFTPGSEPAAPERSKERPAAPEGSSSEQKAS
jgi:hypothetical protein